MLHIYIYTHVYIYTHIYRHLALELRVGAPRLRVVGLAAGEAAQLLCSFFLVLVFRVTNVSGLPCVCLLVHIRLCI